MYIDIPCFRYKYNFGIGRKGGKVIPFDLDNHTLYTI